jgi:integrase
VSQVLARLAPGQSLSAGLLYGSGLRVMECLRLRVGDLDFDRRTIRVCAGKGGKDRVTILRDGLFDGLQRQVARVASVHRQDVREGFVFANTTMIYTHVVDRGGLGALSPLDRLGRTISGR